MVKAVVVLLAFACLAQAALTRLRAPSPAALRVPHTAVQRSRKAIAQLAPGWAPFIDEASGCTYYYNEHSGQSQWAPPQTDVSQAESSIGSFFNAGMSQQTTTTWMLAPHEGVHPEYILHPGKEQLLGRSDMVEANPYVSREQCVVRVDANGVATVTSLGKAQTYVMKTSKKTSVNLAKNEPHVLASEDQIALNMGAKRGIFTVYALPDGYGQEYGYEQYEGYGQQDGYGHQQDGYGHQQGYEYQQGDYWNHQQGGY